MNKREIIFSLIEHPTLGYWPEAYWVSILDNGEMAFDFEKAVPAEVESHPDYVKENVKICDQLHPEKLMRYFQVKSKIHPLEWLEKIKSENGVQWEMLNNYYGKHVYKLLSNLKGKWIGYRSKMDQHPGIIKKYISEQTASTNFIFEKTDTGTKYTLGLKIDTEQFKWKENAVVINDFPCCFMSGDYIYHVSEPTTGKQLSPFFKKDHILIAKQNENAYYERFILKVLKEQQVELKNIPLIKRQHKPLSKISLIEGIDGLPAIKLSFHYGKLTAYPNQEFPHFTIPVKPPAEKGFAIMQRDFEDEKEAVRVVKSMGFVQDEDIYILKDHLKFKKAQEKTDLIHDLIDRLSNHRRLLTSLGIELNTEWVRKTYQTEKPKIRTHISNKESDWFDLQIIIEAGKFKIPFWKLKEYILNRNREYPLPDKSILLIPDEWFAVLGDLIKLGKREAASVKLKPVHLQWINEKNTLPGLDKPIKNREKIYHKQIPEYLLPEDWFQQLRPYQMKGYHWLCHLAEHDYGGVLADDMGLGKTIQLLAFIKKQREHKLQMAAEKEATVAAEETLPQLTLFADENEQPSSFICLVILPTSLIFNWLQEIQKFAPDLKVHVHSGQNRELNSEKWKHFDVILSSYGLVRNDEEIFRPYRFDLIIADESHYIKNPDSKTFRSISLLNARKKVAVTGTPVENGLSDLWSQMTFANPGLLSGFKSFKENFIIPIEKLDDKHVREKLKSITSPFILRRKKAEVASDLPDLTQEIIYCEMFEKQKEIYEEEKSKYRNMLLERLSNSSLHDGDNRFFVLQGLNRLRQIANHPKLIEPEYDNDSGKFEEAVSMLDVLHKQGHKVLVFSQFVKHLELFRNELEQKNKQFAWLTGATKDRKKEVELFQENFDYQTFLISLKAGGVGLNLTAADYVMILDPWWNPAAEEQALNRAHRIGTKHKVMAYRFITKGSIEEKIKVLQKKKKDLSDEFSGSSNPVKYLNENEVKALFD